MLLDGFIAGKKQNNAGVDQGEKALLEIVMAGVETPNKSIVRLRPRDEPTREELIQGRSMRLEYSRLAKKHARAEIVGPEIPVVWLN